MADFTGWDEGLREFFGGLERDNSKAYFDAHRDLYRRAVREPAEAVLAALEPRYGNGRIFRLNRDVRFAADKRPYNTNLGIELSDGGTHHYLSVSAHELVASVGVFRADGDWLQGFREAVAGAPGDALLKIVEDLESSGYTIGGEELKKAPRGYPADHRNARLLRHKGLTASLDWPPSEWLGTPRALELVVDAWERAAPLSDWLRTHSAVGA